MKNHMKAVTSQKEDAEAIIDELQETSGGNYARQMIQRLIQGYKETGIQGDPLQEMKDLLDLFFGDEQINNFTTMVYG